MGSMNDMALVDIAILRQLGEAENQFRSIMMLARQLQADFVIDAGTLKTVEDLLFVARADLAGAILRAIDRLAQYRELAGSAFDAVADLEAETPVAAWPQMFSVRPDYRPQVANDQVKVMA